MAQQKSLRGWKRIYVLRLQKSAKTCEQNDLTCLAAKNKWSEVKTQEFGRLPSHCSKKGKATNYIIMKLQHQRLESMFFGFC